MAALRTFYQRIVDPGASQSPFSDRPLAGPEGIRRHTFFRRLLGASIATFGLTCAGVFNAQAANFTCSWNDATANWTTAADWSSCNGTDPNNVGGNTYDVVISTGDPTLTTAVTIGSVTINSPGASTITGAGASATLTGLLSNAGTFAIDSGASVTTIGVGLTNTGLARVDQSGSGGSSLIVGGALTNSGAGAFLEIGNLGLTASSTVQATSLSNSGAIFVFGNGTAAAELTIAGGLTNTGSAVVDTAGAGGSKVTLGGTLTNSAGATLDIGNSGLSASSTVTATGLSNTGTINLVGNTNVPANQGTVTVNGQASNGGTVNIATASNVTVNGAGNAYTQTAGSTNLSGGSLAAPNVNITGGKLQGMGTVTGVANIGGTGAIEAIDLANNSLPAALAINGNYGQSGGTFDALLHGTGIQIDEVNVTKGTA